MLKSLTTSPVYGRLSARNTPRRNNLSQNNRGMIDKRFRTWFCTMSISGYLWKMAMVLNFALAVFSVSVLLRETSLNMTRFESPSLEPRMPTDLWEGEKLIKIPMDNIAEGAKPLPMSERRYENDELKHLRALGEKALVQYGNEIRNLMTFGGEFLVPNGDPRILHDKKRSSRFRKRLKAMAPWLRGDETQSDWPLSQLPAPVAEEALVICAGKNQLQYLKTLLYTVRVLHSSSMAVYVVFRDKSDFPMKSRTELLNSLGRRSSGISCIDLSTKFDVYGAQLKGWNLKALGMLAVPETKIALMDVDVILLRPPENLFKLDGFQRTGALFFHDRSQPEVLWTPRSFVGKLQPHLSSTARRVLQNGEFFNEHVQEAGVVLLDKARRALGVWAINLLIGRPDIRRFAQQDLVYGDKEMYFSALETISEPYDFARYYPGVIGGILTDFKGTDVIARLSTADKVKVKANMALCGRLLHFDDDGVPLWSNGGYLTKEDDFKASSDLSSSGLQPIWYIDGGDSITEEGPVREGNELKMGMNQKWQHHQAMAVTCLFPNARKIRYIPAQLAMSALKAVQKYVALRKGEA